MHRPGVKIPEGWWDSFRCSHPELSLRQAEPISYARATANNPAAITEYFDLLAETKENNGLKQRPGQIYNCGATGMPLVHKPPKVVPHASEKHPYAITSGNKAQITVLACTNASGYTIPPMVVSIRKCLDGYSCVRRVVCKSFLVLLPSPRYSSSLMAMLSTINPHSSKCLVVLFVRILLSA